MDDQSTRMADVGQPERPPFWRFSGSAASADAKPMKNRIKYLRQQRGWTQEGLAKQLGTTNQQVSRLENGDRSLGKWISRLAKALGVRPGEIVDDLSDLVRIDKGAREFAKDAKEISLLKAWRSLHKREQEALIAVLNGLARRPTQRDDDTAAAG